VDVVFTQRAELPQISWTCSMALYRVAQEAVRNALTHSGARRIDLEVTLLNGSLVVTVADKGRGFSPDSNGGLLGLGLSGMTERMKDIGGTLRVDSAPGAGTSITATVPLAEASQNATETRQTR
jgi:signal transduction histidine kinase